MKIKGPTMYDKVRSLLTDEWQPSYKFIKVMTPLGWLGSSGDRRARELFEMGEIDRKHEGKYSYYKLKDRT